jgi:hypothetical protein
VERVRQIRRGSARPSLPKQDHWPNRVYKDVEALWAAARDEWRAVCLHAETTQPICRCNSAGK